MKGTWRAARELDLTENRNINLIAEKTRTHAVSLEK